MGRKKKERKKRENAARLEGKFAIFYKEFKSMKASSKRLSIKILMNEICVKCKDL